MADTHADDRALILAGKKRFMTEEETALYVTRSPRTVREMRRKRILPAIKLGGTWRYETTRIDAALAALERPSVLPGVQSGNRRAAR